MGSKFRYIVSQCLEFKICVTKIPCWNSKNKSTDNGGRLQKGRVKSVINEPCHETKKERETKTETLGEKKEV